MSRSADLPPENILNRTFKVTIDQQLYESAFNQSSPLDRTLLASLIDELGRSSPKVLAIDLDLSPNPRTPPDAGDRLLKKTLFALADKDIRIILIVPEPVTTATAIKHKIAWFNELAAHQNIRFALSSIYSQDGVVLKYLDSPSGFACTVYLAEKAGGNAKDQCKPADDSYPSLAKNVFLPSLSDTLPGENKPSLLLNRPWRAALNEFAVVKNDMEQLNWNFTGFPPENRIRPYLQRQEDKSLLAIRGDDQARLDGGVVFLGGDYGLTDFYNTPAGKMAGLDIHAGAYYTIHNPIENREYWWPYIIEIILGFALTWAIHELKEFHYKNPHILLRLTYIALFFILLFGVGVFAYILLVSANIWINPAPLFLGAILHDLMSYITGETDNECPCHGGPRSKEVKYQSLSVDWSNKSFSEKTDMLSTIAIYCVVIGYALWYLISHTYFK